MKSSVLRRRFCLVVLFTIMSCFILFSCNDRSRCSINYYSHQIFLGYRDAKGRNLLDPETPNYYKRDDIKSFSFENGVKTELTDQNEGKAIHFWPPIGNIRIEFFKISPPPTILLQLSPSVTDTIRILKYGIDKCDGKTIILNKISYNSNVVYDDEFINKIECCIDMNFQKP